MLIYTVQKGDTLWQIARRNRISLESLIAANPQILDPNQIMPGMQIKVPQNTNVHDETYPMRPTDDTRPGEQAGNIEQTVLVCPYCGKTIQLTRPNTTAQPWRMTNK